MNILFLDIGGVLNEGRENEELYSRERIQKLNNLLDKINLNIIWISSRLRIDSDELIKQDIIDYGFKYPERILGRITNQKIIYNLSIPNYDKLKPSLIKKYIKENKPNYYVILDDDQKLFGKDLNFIKAMLFGMIFSISWTPCIGSFLSSALMLIAKEQDLVKGIVLMLIYSIGLGIPFIISAILLEKLKELFTFIKKNYGKIKKISGIILIIMGIYMIFY